jgi:hypothetical protein
MLSVWRGGIELRRERGCGSGKLFLQTVYISLTNEGCGWMMIGRDQEQQNSDRRSSRPSSPEGNEETGVPAAGGWERRFLVVSTLETSLPVALPTDSFHSFDLRLRSGQAGEVRVPARFSLLSEEQVSRHGDRKDDRDHSVHGEEGCVEPGEIVGLDQRMLVEEQQRDRDDASDGKFS